MSLIPLLSNSHHLVMLIHLHLELEIESVTLKFAMKFLAAPEAKLLTCCSVRVSVLD